MCKRLLFLKFSVAWLLCCLPWASSAGNRLEVEDLCILAGQSKQVPIALINDTAFTACQMDIHLPDALSMQNANGDFAITLSSRFSSSHIITANRVSNGSIRVVIYSLSNAAISGNAGDLLYLNITALSSFNEVSQIQIDNIRFTSTNVREQVLPAVSFTAYNFALDTITTSDSCVWHGRTFYESCIYLDTLQNSSGADSIVVLKLTIPNYTISFLNYDGAILQSSLVATGDMPQYSGEIPLKPATAQYSYVFSSWSPDLSPATRTATYTAVFDSIVNKYVIVFADEDGTELKRDTLDYGTMPIAPEDPTKAATAQYTYAFAGWSPAVALVTGDATYTAVFDSIINQYVIVFADEDGTELKRDTLDYGTMPIAPEDPVKAATAQYTYAFAGWSPAIEAVSGDAIYTATYSSIVNKYLITFQLENGFVLKADSIEYGTIPAFDYEVPDSIHTAQYTYVFRGWKPDPIAVTEDAVYTAVFDSIVNQYTLTLSAENGTVSGGGTFYYGTELTITATPDDGYEFTKWSDDNTDNPRTIILVENLELVAYFKKITNALDDVESSDSHVQKIYRDGHFFVIREEQVFDFTGKKVE